MFAAFINRHVLAFLLFYLFLLFSWSITTGSTQEEQPSPISVMDSGSAQPQDEFEHVSWALAYKDGNLEITIQTSFPEENDQGALPDPLVWEYRIEINGFLVKEGFETKCEATVREMVALASVPEGTHEISLAIRDTAGKLRRQSKTFEFNTTPKITIQPQEAPPGTFDPLITLSFLQLQPDLAGTADLFIDNRLLHNLAITENSNNEPGTLAEFIGHKLFLADLPPGKHLFTIEARSLNGAVARHSLAFQVIPFIPEIRIIHDENKKVQGLEITLAPTANNIVGTVELHLGQSVILALQAERPVMLISRDDIINAFATHKQAQPSEAVQLIVSATGSGNIQNWQEITYR